MCYTLVLTRHAEQRKVSLDPVLATVNDPSMTASGKRAGTRKFVRYEPPPPVVAVTSWPASRTGKLKLISCWEINEDE